MPLWDKREARGAGSPVEDKTRVLIGDRHPEGWRGAKHGKGGARQAGGGCSEPTGVGKVGGGG